MKGLNIVLAVLMVLAIAAAGCGAKKAASSSAAIEQANTMQTVDAKVDYLVGQAKSFYSSKEFQGAVDIAQYVLRYLDSESTAAKDLIEKAKQQLTAQAESMMKEAKTAVSGFGK